MVTEGKNPLMATGVDTEEMLLVHRVIRRELGLAPRLIRGAAGDPARSQRVGAHLEEMLFYLHTHHSGEDEYVWPVLRPRAGLEQDLIDRMEGQHEQVATAITAIEADLPGWTASADRVTGERIVAETEAMTAVLTEHLAEEERRILPLIGELFSQAEWDKLGEHGFAAIPPRRRFVILGHMLEEATPAERDRFVRKNVPPPLRLAYRLFGRRQWARETAGIRSIAA